MKISVDLDGTIADWTNTAIGRCKELYDVDIKFEDVKDYKFSEVVQKAYEAKHGTRIDEEDNHIYHQVCGGDFYLNLPPISGAIEAVKQVKEDGHDIIFVTKPTDWHRSSDHKVKWLAKHFSDIEYEVLMVSKMEGKHLVNVHVIVDDDPRALTNHPTAIPVCVAQPWNEEFRGSDEVGMVVLGHISELPEQVKFIDSLLDEDKQLEF